MLTENNLSSELAAKMVSRLTPDDLPYGDYDEDTHSYFNYDMELFLYQILAFASIDYIKSTKLSKDSQEYKDIVRGITLLANKNLFYLDVKITYDQVSEILHQGYLPLDMRASFFEKDEISEPYNDAYFMKSNRFRMALDFVVGLIGCWEPRGFDEDMEEWQQDGYLNLFKATKYYIAIRERLIGIMAGQKPINKPVQQVVVKPSGVINFDL